MNPSAASAVRFVLDGRTVEATGLPATTTLLDFLRLQLGRTGTKEGCAEGDCGACTVVLGRRCGDDLHYAAINSCIRLLPTVDGAEVVTVESLQDTDGRLHPVQAALVEHHGSQCGFCTPGFVMSLFAHYLERTTTTRADLLDVLSGNLCRCTGYRPILDAGLAAFEQPEPAHWSRADARSAARRARLAGLQRHEALRLPGFSAPRTLGDLAQALVEAPDSLLLAGGTDIGLWVTQQLRELPPLVYLGEVAELARIDTEADGTLVIGAGVPLSAAWPAIVARYPAFAELAQRFASKPVCNSGSFCGNVANGSPIGDSMPALLAVGARLRLQCGTRVREMALDDFYLGYQKKDLLPGEFLSHVRLPPPQDGWRYAAYKLSRRHDQDISALCLGLAVQLDAGQVRDARIGCGGMAATPARARQVEAALIGQPWTAATVAAAGAAFAQDFQPLSDLRATRAYRLAAAANLLQRFFLETQADAPATRALDSVLEPV